MYLCLYLCIAYNRICFFQTASGSDVNISAQAAEDFKTTFYADRTNVDAMKWKCCSHWLTR